MAGARQQLKQIAETVPLKQVEQLLAYASENGIMSEEDVEEPEQLVDIRILFPSGEVAVQQQFPDRTSIGALLQTLSAQNDPCPGRLSLLHGTDVLKRQTKLKHLNLAEDACLYLVKRSPGTYTEWKAAGTVDGQYDYLAKCVILGAESVGKTALLRAFGREGFLEHIPHTIGIDFKIVNLKSEDGLRLKVQLWDTAGQNRFRTITRSYLRGADGFLAVFSLQRRASLEELSDLLEAAEANNPDASRCLCLVGTHADLPDPEVTREEILQLTAKKKCPYFAVSSKTESGIDPPFFAWLDAFLELRPH